MSIELDFPASQGRQQLCIGPLACDLDAFIGRLEALGYTRMTVRHKVQFVRDLSRWMAQRGIGVESLEDLQIKTFLSTRDPGYRYRGEPTTARQLLGHLRDLGRIPAVSSCSGSDDPIRRIESRWERFLIRERGLSPATVNRYLPIVHSFLSEHFGTHAVALERLTGQDGNRFILRHSHQASRSSSKLHATALRSFLRHLYQRGDTPRDLAGAILPVMDWRLSGLPKVLAPQQVEAMLGTCDRTTPIGRRDHAIVLLLARLALRAGEVVVMTLDDVDWNKSVVIVTGKGQKREGLPLPHDVGEALAGYLREGRPRCSTRRLFVRSRAPHVGFSSSMAVCNVVQRALKRAGIESAFKGAHLLRHSLATRMLRHGASLEDIGQILRHRHPETTQIYAKLDLEALRGLAPVWPGART